MSTRTEAFTEVPFTQHTAFTVLRLMLEAVGIHLDWETCRYEDEALFHIPPRKPQLKLTTGFNLVHMPYMTVSTPDGQHLALMEFDDHGIHIKRETSFVVDGLTCIDASLEYCVGLLKIVLDTAGQYIREHLSRFHDACEDLPRFERVDYSDNPA